MRGSGGSRASCFIAFLWRCARRLRARPRQSLRIGRASRTEARGISYKIFLGIRSGGFYHPLRELDAELHEGQLGKKPTCLSPVPRPKNPKDPSLNNDPSLTMIRLSTMIRLGPGRVFLDPSLHNDPSLNNDPSRTWACFFRSASPQ